MYINSHKRLFCSIKCQKGLKHPKQCNWSKYSELEQMNIKDKLGQLFEVF